MHLEAFFVLKDVPEFLPVPRVDFGLYSFEFLLKAKDNGSWGGRVLATTD